MKIVRGMLLTGTALLLLTGIAYAGTSTAREQAQTRQLNLQSQSLSGSPRQPVPVVLDQAAKQPDNSPVAAPSLPVQAAEAQALAPMALNSITNPPAKIATARVMDERGTTVGAVHKVEMDSYGKPTQVLIALLGSDRIVALGPDALSYDVTNNVVTAALDKNQIAQLPAQPLQEPRG